MNGLALGLAFILDILIGDPYSWPHPVKVIGNTIDVLTKAIRRISTNPVWLRLAGFFMTILVVAGSWIGVKLLILISWMIISGLDTVVGILIAYTCLATRGLYDQTWRVALALKENDLDRARNLLGYVVGRETATLDRPAVIRALVETIAENLSDGVIAPLFYLALGGPALGLAYKAVNTLDSMVGYKNDKYRDLGWFAANLDDLVNYIPARITALLITVSARILGLDAGNAVNIWLRDGRRHSSPNAGVPEAAVAGALGIRLGGPNVYHGVLVKKPYIGDGLGDASLDHVYMSERLLWVSSGLMLILSIIARELII